MLTGHKWSLGISSNFWICILGHIYSFGHLQHTAKAHEVLRAYFLGISVPFIYLLIVSKMSAAQHTVNRIGFVLTSPYSDILSEPALDKRQSLDGRLGEAL